MSCSHAKPFQSHLFFSSLHSTTEMMLSYGSGAFGLFCATDGVFWQNISVSRLFFSFRSGETYDLSFDNSRTPHSLALGFLSVVVRQEVYNKFLGLLNFSSQTICWALKSLTPFLTTKSRSSVTYTVWSWSVDSKPSLELVGKNLVSYWHLQYHSLRL